MNSKFIKLIEELENYNRAKNRLSKMCLEIFLDLNRQNIPPTGTDFLEVLLENYNVDNIPNKTRDCVQLELHNTAEKAPLLDTLDTLNYWISKVGTKALSVINEDKEAFNWYYIEDLDSRGSCRLIEKLKQIA